MDVRGVEAAGPFIEAASPTYPCLIDVEHRVAELYGMVNVPQAVWIDESGHIVRPTEAAGTSDAFRNMPNGLTPEDLAELGSARQTYTDALRDWVANGEASYAWLSPEQVRERVAPAASDDVALATAHFRLGTWLRTHGREAEGDEHLTEAKRLAPDSWSFSARPGTSRRPATSAAAAPSSGMPWPPSARSGTTRWSTCPGCPAGRRGRRGRRRRRRPARRSPPAPARPGR